MKKVFLLNSYLVFILLLFNTNIISQTIINFDDNAKWTAGSGELTSYQTNHQYNSDNWNFTGGPALRNTTTAQDGFPGALGTYSWRLRDNNLTSWTATYTTSGTLTQFGFKVRRWDSTPSPDFSIEYSTNGGTNYISIGTTINNAYLNNSSDWKQFSYTISSPTLTSANQFIVRVKANGTTERIMIDDFSFSIVNSSPTISISPASLSFGSVLIDTNSAAQSYTVTGNNLTNYLIIDTETPIFTISINPLGPFSQTLSLTPTGGTVSQTIYMRFNPQSATDYSKNISHSSTGATTQYLTATGKGIKAEPSNHVTNFNITTTTPSSITITWTDATGDVLPDAYLIKGSSVSYENITSPVDGTPESDGTLVKNISQGTQTVTFSGLNSNTTYYFKIFPYTNSAADINYKTDGSVPQTSGSTTGISSAYFRSKQNGNWNQTSSWETSNDNSNWSDATTTPNSSSNIITIRNGHTINITELVTIDQTVIESGGILNYSADSLVIADGDGDDLTIYGTFKHSVSKYAPYSAGATIRVKTGGILEVNNNGISASHYGISNQIYYENGATYYWNVSSGAQFITSNVTYFPNSTVNEIPVFRVNTPDIYVGAGAPNPTTINGIFQVDANTVYWQYEGIKTFRNGIRGSGNIVQRSDANTCGQFIISGTNAELGGTGTLSLNSNGLTISNTANVNLTSDKTVNGGTLTVNGVFNTANNVLSGTTNFALNSNSSLSIGSANGITSSGATGNIQNSGARTFNTGANYIYNGSSAQSTGNGLPATVNNLTIDNSSGVTLSQNVAITNSLTLNNGILNTSSNNISFSTSATAPTETATKYILGNAVMQSRDLGTGGISDFLGLSISSGSGQLNGLTFTRNTGTAKNFGTNQSITCSWDITGTINAERTLTLKWFDTFDNGKLFSETNLGQLWKSTDNGTTWTPQGNPVNVSGNNPRSLSVNVSSFSSWTASDNLSPLPVRLASLNASAKLRDVKLSWSTAEEINNSGFDVERKTVNGEWHKAGFVHGNNKPSTYEFTDKNLTTGKYHYRLKQIDFNGNFEYHNLDGIVEIGVPSKFDLSQNYPNPFNPVTKINFDLPKSGNVSIKVYDMLGKEVKTLIDEFKDAGYYNITFDASNLPSGVYFYRLTSGEFSAVKKLVLMK